MFIFFYFFFLTVIFREDCVLHELVIKIFPQVFEQDKEDERRFYEYIGRPIDGGDVYETTSLTKRTELSGRSVLLMKYL